MSGGAHYLYGDDPVEINANRARTRLTVANTGDRAVQVGSHYHFFETNRALRFTREVELCAFGGNGRLTGFAALVNGGLSAPDTRRDALRRAAELGFVQPGSG